MRRNTNQRRGGSGLLGTVARTTAVVGTATVVSNKVDRSMTASAQKQEAAKQQEINAAAQQMLAAQQVSHQVAPPVAAAGADRITQLQQLAELKQQGILNDAEFEAEKARILAQH